MQLRSNTAIVACAGARKTQEIVDLASGVAPERALIVTYTNENQRQIVSRLSDAGGLLPAHISVLGWFNFLINQCARPYQRVLAGAPNVLRSLNFKGRRDRYTPRADSMRYFCDCNRDLYRDTVADFVCEANARSAGAVISRLERIYRYVFIDEVQDLAAYDLEVLELLLRSSISVLAVGDPRQSTLATSNSTKNKSYRGRGLLSWLRAREREGLCAVLERCENFRCNQAICDFADGLYPDLPVSTSRNSVVTGHDGVLGVPRSEAVEYFEVHRPVVLRHDKNADTLGLPAMNIGVAKGSTYDHVMIFPTKPMLAYWTGRDHSQLKAPERLYVAVTRARFSVAFVVPG